MLYSLNHTATGYVANETKASGCDVRTKLRLQSHNHHIHHGGLSNTSVDNFSREVQFGFWLCYKIILHFTM